MNLPIFVTQAPPPPVPAPLWTGAGPALSTGDTTDTEFGPYEGDASVVAQTLASFLHISKF